MNNTVFCAVTPCEQVQMYRRFGGRFASTSRHISLLSWKCRQHLLPKRR